MSALREYRTFAVTLAAFVGITLFIYLVPTDALIERIGISNTYAFAFLVSLLAGFSSLTGSAAYAAVIEFARAGASPLWLGVISGTGIFLSDSGFYALGKRGRDSLRKPFSHLLERTQRFIERVPDPVVYVIVYLFSAFGPIPNDVLLLSLILGGYTYRRFWPFLLAGDITFMLFLGYLFTGQ